ncbi:Sushi domain-containing protein 1 [Acipenser ruthenus]|uniref:Sushi domain-containing protein 1 n=1 Tax=Acipenser ruthenus TaxID=7906 RepID=A0A444U6L4_ACIRT|nr:Sushi domain-containing protein 1 [Acipenser ruthenus]
MQEVLLNCCRRSGPGGRGYETLVEPMDMGTGLLVARTLVAVRNGKMQFKLDGLRGYQKDFLDKRIINFTSGDDTPEICLNLQPGTNYTINITALSVGYSIRAIITTSITDPPVPQVAFIVAEGPLPPLRLLRAAETNGPISLYQVVVLPMDGPLVFNCSSLNMPNFYSKKGGGGAYVTAELYAEDIADELVFNVGDRQYYGDYYNAPLEEGRGYNVILRVVSEWCQVRKQSCVNWAQTKGAARRDKTCDQMADNILQYHFSL